MNRTSLLSLLVGIIPLESMADPDKLFVYESRRGGPNGVLFQVGSQCYMSTAHFTSENESPRFIGFSGEVIRVPRNGFIEVLRSDPITGQDYRVLRDETPNDRLTSGEGNRVSNVTFSNGMRGIVDVYGQPNLPIRIFRENEFYIGYIQVQGNLQGVPSCNTQSTNFCLEQICERENNYGVCEIYNSNRRNFSDSSVIVERSSGTPILDSNGNILGIQRGYRLVEDNSGQRYQEIIVGIISPQDRERIQSLCD